MRQPTFLVVGTCNLIPVGVLPCFFIELLKISTYFISIILSIHYAFYWQNPVVFEFSFRSCQIYFLVCSIIVPQMTMFLFFFHVFCSEKRIIETNLYFNLFGTTTTIRKYAVYNTKSSNSISIQRLLHQRYHHLIHILLSMAHVWCR